MTRKRERVRRLRVILGGASLGMVVLSAWALQPVTGLADSSSIAVDRQAYVSDQGADAYQVKTDAFGGSGPDNVDIHVGATASQSTYHSLVHLELEAIPSDATVQQLSLTLFPTTDPMYASAENVNTAQAVLDAYPLKTELTAGFPGDKSNPPVADTTWPVIVGQLNDADKSWSFDLSKLVPYWHQHGNTGAAIVPDPVASQPWSIGFDRTLSAATAGFAFAAPQPSRPQSQTAPVQPLGITDNGPGLALGLPPGTVNTQPAPAPAPAPVQQSGRAVPRHAPAASAGGAGGIGVPGTVPLWLMVLGISAAASVALLAQPVSQALGAAGGILAGLGGQLKLHPRMFAVAGVLVIWSSSLGVYANTVGRSTLGGSGGSVADNGSTGIDNGTAGTPSSDGTPTTSPSGPGATGSGTSQTGNQNGGRPLTGAAAYLNAPNAPHPPAADLFGPGDNTVGITNTTIQLCAHAALTFGPAFNIGAADLNVFWQMINDHGGIWGRKLVQSDGKTAGITFQDDGYQPSKAVTAAQACQDQTGGDFFLLGGIGFDQVPAVRVWAEQHHMPYIHHIATANGSQGLRYSYTMLPTLEQIGTQYGQYYVGHYSGVKIGVVYRNSSNWQPGLDAFNNYLKQAGQYGNVVDEESVINNQGDYSAQITKMHSLGAQMVFIYENALAAEQFIQQSSNQQWNPQWLMFPFNLTLETLHQAGVDTSRMDGVIPWPSYTCNASADPRYAAYKAELQKFEAAYAQYDPGASLCGDGGDLLFGTWLAWEQTYDLLYQCGPACTRNNIAGLMQSGYHATVGANCAVDFRGGDGHHGGLPEDVDKVETVNGAPGWVTTALCVKDLR